MTDFQRISARAKGYEKQMVRFLRDIVAIPSESTQEDKVIARVKREMRATKAFDRVWTDPMGNLFGRIGRGRTKIAIDAGNGMDGYVLPEFTKRTLR